MLISTRTTFRLLIALAAATVAYGYSYNEEDGLSARDLGLSYSEIEYARNYADDGAFVLSARDLEQLDIREEDISNVLVIRVQPSITDPVAMLAWTKKKKGQAKVRVAQKKAALDHAISNGHPKDVIKDARQAHQDALGNLDTWRAQHADWKSHPANRGQ